MKNLSGFAFDLFVTNGLISSYCRSGENGLAREVFDGSVYNDLVSWNSIMSVMLICGELGEAQKLFDEMRSREAFSWAILIDGYVMIAGNVGRAQELFDQSSEKDLVCWHSMIVGYSNVGDMDSARGLFEVIARELFECGYHGGSWLMATSVTEIPRRLHQHEAG